MKKSFALNFKAGKLLCLLGISASLLVGCESQISPQSHVYAPISAGSNIKIYVTSAEQRDTIIASLHKAGLHTVDKMDVGDYVLRVSLGVEQGEQDCGTLNNIRYELRSQDVTLIAVKAKGWTGSCQPNAFDAMSGQLRQNLISKKE